MQGFDKNLLICDILVLFNIILFIHTFNYYIFFIFILV